MATIRDTDLLYVQRGETPHNWTGLELKSLVSAAAKDGKLIVGQYLTPNGQQYDGSGNLTINVDATSAATANKVVVRDSNGNFAGNVITATSFVGDGQNLTNTGATLSVANGNQRLVMTNLTSGTMVEAATDPDLYFNASTNTLHCTNFSGDGSSLTSLTATKLETARLINGTEFDGSADITTIKWGTSRKLNGVDVDGSADYILEPYVEHDDDSNSTRPLVFVDNEGAGYKRLNMDTSLTYNPSSNQLEASMFVGDLTGNASSASSADNATNFNVEADDDSNTNHYVIFTVGATGNQRPNSDTSFYYNPSSDTLNAGNFNSTSDITLKTDVAPIDGALSRLSNIEGVGFTWKKTGDRSYGVIAQNIEKEFPELVQSEEFKSVNYNGLVGVLIEAVKEQQKQIDELKEQIKSLSK